MARMLAQAGRDAVFSYAGRTNAPVAQPLPMRVGGFGGITGLRKYLKHQQITHVIDATHPFAAQMSTNAFGACHATNIRLIRLERSAWVARTGDSWTHIPRLEDAPAALPNAPSRVFLAIGKQQLDLFTSKPQHHYLLRLVDPPAGKLPLPDTHVVIARGPFDVASDTALLKDHGITHIVAKNAGGNGAQAKLDAARTLGIPVILADRPVLPGDNVTDSLEKVMAWLGHGADRGV